jgi:hypothetical protein
MSLQTLLIISYINFNICCILFITLSSFILYYCCRADIIELINIFKPLLGEIVSKFISGVRITISELIRGIDSFG